MATAAIGAGIEHPAFTTGEGEATAAAGVGAEVGRPSLLC